jgi:hypothetical protein
MLAFIKIWTNLQESILSKTNQAHKGKYYMISFICGTKNMISLKYRVEERLLLGRKVKRDACRNICLQTQNLN